MKHRLLLIGCGKMGGAMLSGWIARGQVAADVVVVDPGADAARFAADFPGVKLCRAHAEIPAGFQPDVMIVAVKPQVIGDVLPPYSPMAKAGALALSIAAGTPVVKLKALLGADAAVVRSMPNTPAAIGKGITVLCASEGVGAPQKTLCATLLSAVGETAWVEDEALMDAVTAVSGSGPAYVFLLAEVMAQAGEKAGLPADLAARLANATVAGAGALLAASDEPPATLRKNVTSPGGTTAAALEVLMAPTALPGIMEKAVAAATRRSKELAG